MTTSTPLSDTELDRLDVLLDRCTDPETGLAFAYVMNRMRFDAGGDPRSAALVRALYDCVR